MQKARVLLVTQKAIGEILGFDFSGVFAKSFASPYNWFDSADLGTITFSPLCLL